MTDTTKANPVTTLYGVRACRLHPSTLQDGFATVQEAMAYGATHAVGFYSVYSYQAVMR